MILQSLVRCYDSLAAQGTLKRPGWSAVKVQWGLCLTADGQVSSVEMLGAANDKGKLLPVQDFLPTPVKRTSGRAACFLCDNAKYLLGITNEPYNGTGKTPSKRRKPVSKPVPRSIMRCWTAYPARWRRQFSAFLTLGSLKRQRSPLPCRSISMTCARAAISFSA